MNQPSQAAPTADTSTKDTSTNALPPSRNSLDTPPTSHPLAGVMSVAVGFAGKVSLIIERLQDMHSHFNTLGEIRRHTGIEELTHNFRECKRSFIELCKTAWDDFGKERQRQRLDGISRFKNQVIGAIATQIEESSLPPKYQAEVTRWTKTHLTDCLDITQNHLRDSSEMKEKGISGVAHKALKQIALFEELHKAELQIEATRQRIIDSVDKALRESSIYSSQDGVLNKKGLRRLDVQKDLIDAHINELIKDVSVTQIIDPKDLESAGLSSYDPRFKSLVFTRNSTTRGNLDRYETRLLAGIYDLEYGKTVIPQQIEVLKNLVIEWEGSVSEETYEELWGVFNEGAEKLRKENLFLTSNQELRTPEKVREIVVGISRGIHEDLITVLATGHAQAFGKEVAKALENAWGKEPKLQNIGRLPPAAIADEVKAIVEDQIEAFQRNRKTGSMWLLPQYCLQQIESGIRKQTNALYERAVKFSERLTSVQGYVAAEQIPFSDWESFIDEMAECEYLNEYLDHLDLPLTVAEMAIGEHRTGREAQTGALQLANEVVENLKLLQSTRVLTYGEEIAQIKANSLAELSIKVQEMSNSFLANVLNSLRNSSGYEEYLLLESSLKGPNTALDQLRLALETYTRLITHRCNEIHQQGTRAGDKEHLDLSSGGGATHALPAGEQIQ
jgi:hypothetical protein